MMRTANSSPLLISPQRGEKPFGPLVVPASAEKRYGRQAGLPTVACEGGDLDQESEFEHNRGPGLHLSYVCAAAEGPGRRPISFHSPKGRSPQVTRPGEGQGWGNTGAIASVWAPLLTSPHGGEELMFACSQRQV